MRRYVLFLFACVLSVTIGGLTVAQTDTGNCSDTLPSRLVIGEYGRVTAGDSNRVREEPSTSSASIGQIPGGAQFMILDGPVCEDGFAWWQVDYDGLIGWTAEGSDVYWLEPVVSTEVSYEGVSFMLDEQIGSIVNGSLVLYTDDPDLPYWEILPDRMELTFDDYINGNFWTTFRIYPVADYEAVVGVSLDELRDMLETQPEEIPVFNGAPFINAAQIFQLRPTYIEFQNGMGFRYITFVTQSIEPIGTLHYVFTGLTDDGDYLVNATFPIHTDLIFADAVLSYIGLEYEAFTDQYDEYLEIITDVFESGENTDFSPSLSDIDAMMASLVVEPTVVLGGMEDTD